MKRTQTKRWARPILYALLGSVLVLHSMPARADANASDAAAAEALFNQGKKLMAEGKLEEACPKFAEANRLDSGIGTMLYLADCYEKNKKTASAWAIFKEAAEQAKKQADGREKLARDRAAALEPSLSRLAVVVDGPSRVDGMIVTRDGKEVGAAQWSLEVPIDPGEHRITASAKGRKPWSTTVTLAAAHTEKVQIPPLALAPETVASPSQPPPGSNGKTQRSVGILIGGVGIVGLGVGTFFGISAKSKADAAGPFCNGSSCQQPGLDDWSSAKSQANVATIAFVAGGALLAAGAVIYIVAPSNSRAQAALADVARGGFSF